MVRVHFLASNNPILQKLNKLSFDFDVAERFGSDTSAEAIDGSFRKMFKPYLGTLYVNSFSLRELELNITDR